jgi:hypothetical protein
MNSNFLRVVNHETDVCKACSFESRLFDVVDFHGNIDLLPAQVERKKAFPLTGIPVYYFRCGRCGLVYTRAMDAFSAEDFSERIYNRLWRKHLLGDPIRRSREVASLCSQLFPVKSSVRGLDYGGGLGELSDRLEKNGYAFENYDPFCNGARRPAGHFNLITCIEVFEHVVDVAALMDDLDRLCARDGGVFFTTVLCESLSRCQGWVYCVPRSGHITFFTRESLTHVFAARGFTYFPLGTVGGYHCHYASRGAIPYLGRGALNPGS